MLDRDTDLTEDRLFHGKTNTFIIKSTLIVEKLYELLGIHTFYLVKSDHIFDSDIKMCLAKSGLFLTDMEKQLYEYYSNIIANTSKYCDCCGRIMNNWLLSVLDPIKYTKRFDNTDICQECNRKLDKNNIKISRILRNIIMNDREGDNNDRL